MVNTSFWDDEDTEEAEDFDADFFKERNSVYAYSESGWNDTTSTDIREKGVSYKQGES